ncbi:RNA polymerase sigma factor, partial [Specibacter sp. AOP5-B1-6]|uniref:RNA polymerase sigma factor n=1 Tax=Specibacter sp. AOP5-B1-6 TaxID=3457653 RepID=UPI00402B5342
PTGDLSLAEDSLSAAFEQALTTWPGSGVPRNPEAWLLTVARNRQRDAWKSAFHRTSAPLEAASRQGGDAVLAFDDIDVEAVGDKRLELLFVCAHPAIDPGIRTPLMLQTVLGFDAARIAAAFALPAPAMAQRLVRAKKRIKEARIPFVVPDRTALAGRLTPVLEAIYGCYAIACQEEEGAETWGSEHGQPSPEGPGAEEPRTEDLSTDDVRGENLDADDASAHDLSGEAQYLALTLARLLRTEPEPWGLAALITLSMARAPGQCVTFVPLEDQDTASWNARLIAEGGAYLRRAAASGGRREAKPGGRESAGRECRGRESSEASSGPSRRPGSSPGRFELEAAIQAVHCERARTLRTDWAALRILYTALVEVAPTLGARVALAAVIGRTDTPAAGLAAIDAIAATDTPEVRAAVDRFQPFHAARAELLVRAGRTAEAVGEFKTAAALAGRTAIRDHLLRRAESGTPAEQ